MILSNELSGNEFVDDSAIGNIYLMLLPSIDWNAKLRQQWIRPFMNEYSIMLFKVKDADILRDLGLYLPVLRRSEWRREARLRRRIRILIDFPNSILLLEANDMHLES